MANWPRQLGTGTGAQFGTRHDWSTEEGIQAQPPPPKAVRVAYLLEGIADEFRGLAAGAAIDGKRDVLLASTCTLELGISWMKKGEGSIAFWVLEIGGGVSREQAQKVTVEMSLQPEVPLIIGEGQDGGLSPDEITNWNVEPKEAQKGEVTRTDGGTLRLAYMLDQLADEFRRAKAGAAGKQAVLRYDKVTLELTGTTGVEGSLGAKFWVVDLAAGASREETQTITVEMTPTDSDKLAQGGISFLTFPDD